METLEINEKFRKNQGILLTKLLISHLIIAIDDDDSVPNLISSKPKTQYSHSIATMVV